MLNKNIETFIGCDANYKDADIVIFGAPFDSTTSYRPGARFGPSAIRHESYGIETYSPYQDKDLLDKQVFDSGDIELCIGDAKIALNQIEKRVNTILKDGKRPLMLGGEHLVTYPVVKALHNKYKDLHIIHFDAHADLRNDYLGVKLSHACVIRRCHDILGDNKIFQFGIRSGDKEEFEFAKNHTYMNKFNLDTLENIVNDLKQKNVPIYFTIDLDVIDPAYFPGTGTPEAGGINFEQLKNAIILIGNNLNIVGADINELAPNLDNSGISTAIACKILRELLLAI